jgi:hypothetical protein
MDRDSSLYVLGIPNTEVRVVLQQIVKLGVNFSTETRTVATWKQA